MRRLPQTSTEALDALAGFMQQRRCRRVGNPEGRAEPERRALHHRDPLRIEKLGDEVLVGADLMARRRRLADGAGAGRKDVERSFRLGAMNAFGLVEHRHAKVAPLLEDPVVHRDEVLADR